MKVYILGAFVVMGLGLIGLAGIVLTSKSAPDYMVERYTGLKLPSSYSIVSQGDTRGGMHGNGEWWLVVRVKPTVTASWLEGQPFNGASSWQRGPVPFKIGIHSRFGKTVQAVATREDEHRLEYTGSQYVAKLLSSDDVHFAALDLSEELPWHAGRIIIVDKKTNTIWMSVWFW